MKKNLLLPRQRIVAMLSSAAVAFVVAASFPAAAATPAAIPISQVPLTIAIPAHPQILLAIANSESMDGNLSGAIMTGSGSLGAAYAGLNSSSSPVNFTIPSGFTPPLNAGSAGVAPYTVNSGGSLYDNSPSRLNVAKQGVGSIISTYMANADFALMDYDTSSNGLFTTWVYQMSQSPGFTFTSVVSTTTEQVANPCYNINILLSNPVSQNCAVLNGVYSSQNILTQLYMNVSASSDDPSINDVLYDPYALGPICTAYNGPSPPNPYPPNFTLSQFNAGGFSVHESYSFNYNNCATNTGPTNAGFVPFSPQVMYEQRGFGYGANQSPTDGTVLVGMTSAGATPTAPFVAAQIAKFAPFLAPETNNTGTTEIKSSAGQSPMAGLMAKAGSFFATNPPSSNGCVPTRYVILVTDGLPTLDLSGKTWPPLGSAAAAGYGVTATFNTSTDQSLATTNDQALTDVITKLTALKSSGVLTYIVGLGAGVDPTKNPTAAATLTAMAVAGGTGNASATGYFAATNPTALTNDLQQILVTILSATQSVASVAVNSTGLSTNTVVYQSQFSSSDQLQDWTGNLFAFPVSPTTGIVDTMPADAIWSATTMLDLQNWNTGRFIATWDPVAGAATPFRWNPGTPTTGIANTTVLGQDLTTFSSDTNGSDVVNFLRGANAQEVRFGGPFRNRTHKLGDIVFSNPAYVGSPSGVISSPSYASFALAQKNRPPVLYVGANDGMLHAFDATTGSERFAYIPTGVYANLINLASPFYNASHLFYVDGSPVSTDVQFADNSWHTLLLGTEAAGGKSMFAIDVTDPTAITSENALSSLVLWDFMDTDLGLTYAAPAVANTNNGTMIFLGNGYDSTNEKPFLYVLKPQTGAVFAKVDLCAAVPTACNLSVANGLSSALAVNTSGQGSAAANIVYAGDLQGNLWRIDISNASPASWTVSVLLQARDSLGNAQPITTPPIATLNPQYPQLLGTFVFVGTGQLISLSDLPNTKIQTIYGVYDPPAAYTLPLNRSSLVQQTLSSGLVGTTVVATVTSNAVSIPTTKGWYIDLTLNSGERVVENPLLKSGALVVTSTQPSTSLCASGGNSFLYVINYANGAAFATPQFDVNGDGTINSADMSGTKVPVGVLLGSGFYAGATIVNQATPGGTQGPGGPGSCPVGYYESYSCPEAGNSCTPRCLKGSGKRRIAWWEVKK